MSRRHSSEQRRVLPDPIHGSRDLQKFINCIMLDGKKSVAEGIVYGALESIESRTNRNPFDVFQEAIENVKPVVEIKPRRVGGQTYQVPVEVRPERRLSLAYRWLIIAARNQRGEKSMQARLAGELLDAANNDGNAVRRKLETHRMAEANKAFSHYRW